MSTNDAIAAHYGLAVWLNDQLVMYAPLKLAGVEVQPANDAEAATLGRACVLDVTAKDKHLAMLFAHGDTYVTKSETAPPRLEALTEGQGQVHVVEGSSLEAIEGLLVKLCSLGGAFPMIVSERKIDLPGPEEMAEMSADEQRALFDREAAEELRWWGDLHGSLTGAEHDRFNDLVDDVAYQMTVAFIDMMVSDKDAYIMDEDASETITRNRNMYEQAKLFQAKVNLATAQLSAGLRDAAEAAEPFVQDVVSTETLDNFFDDLDALLAESTETNGDDNA